MKITKVNLEKFIYIGVFFTLLLSSIIIVVMFPIEPIETTKLIPYAHNKNDYLLKLIQCILGLIAIILPKILQYKKHIIVPPNLMISYALFLFAAIYLGEIRSFYYTIPYWDILLHTFSGGMLGILGFSLIELLNKNEKSILNPLLIAIFTFCFAVTLGTIWEIYEFSFDSLLGLNMQKFALFNGNELTGHSALADTMEDLIVDCFGSLVTSVIGYLSLRNKKEWLNRMLLRLESK